MSDTTLIDVRCPHCQKLLFQATGLGPPVKIKCSRCGTLVQWPSLAPEVIYQEKPPKLEVKGVGGAP